METFGTKQVDILEKVKRSSDSTTGQTLKTLSTWYRKIEIMETLDV